MVELLTRNDGVVIMAPPSDNAEARKAIATLLSAIKPKQKVRGEVLGGSVGTTLLQAAPMRVSSCLENPQAQVIPLVCSLTSLRHRRCRPPRRWWSPRATAGVTSRWTA